tara:strand:+ start:35821 stop:36321 length:501 start_codon:yes stop_codon:yes gene_type:complete
MIDKLEAGKTYKLVDKYTYLTRLGECNADVYSKCFKDDKVTLDSIINGNGFVNGYNGSSVISNNEYTLFELVGGYESLQQINSPFGELDKQTKKDLLCAWVDGAEIEWKGEIPIWSVSKNPCWFNEWKYRVKPTISAKDAAKAKLISEAQQQLRDAQEALDKAQQL